MLEISGSDADGASTVSLKPGMTASGRQSRAKGATPRELADMLARLLGGGSVLFAMWLEAEIAALEPDEADAIAEPLARILSRQSWGKKVGKYLVNGDDYVALTFALTAYTLRVAPLVRGKLSHHAKPVSGPAAPIRPTQSGQPSTRSEPEPARASSASNGHQPELDVSGGVRFSGVAGFGAESA